MRPPEQTNGLMPSSASDAIRLRVWADALLTVHYQTESGLVREEAFPSVAERREHHCVGFASRIGTEWIAVYSLGGELFLQVGSRRWPLGGERTRMRWRRGWFRRTNHFALVVDGEVAFSARYPSARSIAENRRDPTFDYMDEVSSDFLLWLATVFWPDRPRVQGARSSWLT